MAGLQALPAAEQRRLLGAAVEDNVGWVGTVARVLGIGQARVGGVWAAGAATPDGYPEAVTAAPGVAAGDVLAALPRGAAVRSVKDSFADVDLSAHGFGVLLDGWWTGHPPPAPDPGAAAAWSRVTDPVALDAWRAARHDAGAPVAAFVPDLLAEPTVTLLARGGRDAPDAWAVATPRTRGDGGPVVGVSSVGARDSSGGGAWPGLLAALAALAPGAPVVGWEAGADLDEALGAGFVALGPLRVWVEGP